MTAPSDPVMPLTVDDPLPSLARQHPLGTTTIDAALFALFFSSGFVALLYQVIWQRLLGLIAGLDLYAVTLIVAVYMLGMGLGSYLGGLLADRLPPRRLLLTFAIAELVVAAWALASKAVYRDVFYERAASLGDGGSVVAAVAAATLLVPTICMGLTLPVLSKALTRSLDTAADKIAGLYGWNTIGAAVGAWLGSSLIVRALGYERSLWAGAAVNIGCALCALALMKRGAALPAPDRASASRRGEIAAESGWSWKTWLAVYFLSGFLALGLEMVWFRLLGVLLKSTAYTFPLLLSFYLFGVGAGSLVGRSLAARVRSPLRAFLLVQAGVTIYAALSVSVLVWALGTRAGIARTHVYLTQYDPIEFSFNFTSLTASQLFLYVAIPVLLILPPTILMGLSFPLLQRGAQSDLGSLGRRVGMLQTANILGSTGGVVIVGLLLIDWFGAAGTLRILTGGSVVFLLIAASGMRGGRERGLRGLGAGLVVLAVAAVVWVVPSTALLWARFHGVSSTQVLYAEDGTGVTVLTNTDPGFRRRTDVYVNGLGQSWIPYSGVHSYLGLVPVLLHPTPRRIAIIGLGSGDTVYSAAGRPETERIDCIEIIAGQLATLRELHTRSGYPGLGGLLGDPRIRFIVGDGRRYMMGSRERFDIIEADALRPGSAYSGTVYSREYFELVRTRLAPGGMAVTWAPTARVHHTFLDVFPYVVAVDPMLIGSNEPIALDADAVRARARVPATAAHYRQAAIDLDAYVEDLVKTMQVRSRPGGASSPDMLNTDLFPRDELRTP